MGNPLVELNREYRQSVWYDNLNRKLIATGALRRMVEEDGVTGGTSNPTIFEKALASTDAYDEHFRELVSAGKDATQIYDALTVTDVQLSCDAFRPAYDATEAADGYGSLEVSPELAYDTAATAEAARRAFRQLGRPNAMIKIPGTREGLPAIEQCLTEGLNINITLLFGVANYEQVGWAYVSALEKRLAAGEPIDRIGSVASFFVSRVDTLTDDKLQEKIVSSSDTAEKERLSLLLGKAAIANAKIAYAKFQEITASSRWQALAERGARVQRCLWASTSTKNPDYRDVMYVDGLIGPDTINTMPQNTLDAFREHGELSETLTQDLDYAFDTIRQIEQAGIDFRAVTDELQAQGVKLFTDSFRTAFETIERRRRAEPVGQRPS